MRKQEKKSKKPVSFSKPLYRFSLSLLTFFILSEILPDLVANCVCTYCFSSNLPDKNCKICSSLIKQLFRHIVIDISVHFVESGNRQIDQCWPFFSFSVSHCPPLCLRTLSASLLSLFAFSISLCFIFFVLLTHFLGCSHPALQSVYCIKCIKWKVRSFIKPIENVEHRQAERDRKIDRGKDTETDCC